MILCHSVLLRMKNVIAQRSSDDQNTNFKISYSFFRKSCCCEIIWKNILEPDRPQMTVWLMRIACFVPKAKNTHSEYVKRKCFSTVSVAARTRFNVILYGSNRGWGKIFRTHPDRPRGPLSLLCNGYRVSVPGVERPMRDAEHPLHLAPESSRFRAITSGFSLYLHSI